MIQISNQHLIVTMTQEGGTLTSIRDAKTGREYLWQGDPAYWTGRLPICSRLWEGCMRKPTHSVGRPIL